MSQQKQPEERTREPATDGHDGSEETFKEFSQEYSEEGLATLLIVTGAILFVFPEPITSVVGIGLLLTGAATWVSDWIWG